MINLSVSDLLLCLVTMPLTFMELVCFSWPLGNNPLLCKLAGSMEGVSVYCSTLTIASIALDRYHVIVFSTDREGQSPFTAPVLISATWLGSVLLASPMLIFRSLKHHPLPEALLGVEAWNFCVEEWPGDSSAALIYSIANTMFQFFIPVAVIVFAHASICARLRQRFRRSNRSGLMSATAARRQHRRHNKTHQLLSAIALTRTAVAIADEAVADAAGRAGEAGLLLGGAGGRLQTGRILDYRDKPNRKMCSLYLSLMDKFDVRLDQNVGAADRLFFKYSWDNTSLVIPGFIPVRPGAGVDKNPYLAADGTYTATDTPLRNQSATFNYVKVFTPSLINETRLGVVRWNQNIEPLGNPFNTASAIGIPGVNINDKSGGLPSFTITGFSGLGDNSTYPEVSRTTSFQYENLTTWTRGNHTLKAGGVYVRHRFNGFSAFPTRGDFSFNGQFTRQIGATTTTLSPVSTTLCSALVTPSMAAPGTVTRAKSISTPTLRLRKSAMA